MTTAKFRTNTTDANGNDILVPVTVLRVVKRTRLADSTVFRVAFPWGGEADVNGRHLLSDSLEVFKMPGEPAA